MPHDTRMAITDDEPMAAVFVARWLVVALPQDLAEALDRYVASLGPEAMPGDAVRQILRQVLLSQEPSPTPVMLQPGIPY